MVCHICAMAASLDCPICHRGACSKHSERDPGGVRADLDGHRRFIKTQAMMCTACADDWRADTEKLRHSHHCDFCGENNPSALTTVECAKCHKRFCAAHGQLVTASWFKGLGHESRWFRCTDHKVTGGTSIIRKGGLFALAAGQPDPEKEDLNHEMFLDSVDWTYGT